MVQTVQLIRAEYKLHTVQVVFNSYLFICSKSADQGMYVDLYNAVTFVFSLSLCAVFITPVFSLDFI